MCDVITFEVLREIICDFADMLHANAAYLTELDTAIGDGDHGRNMALGFESVREHLLDIPPTAAPGVLLRSAGMTLVATVGGASGPLYAAAFIAAGMAAGTSPALSLPDLAQMVRAAADALARRGRCRMADKTILDALEPAARALAEAATTNRTLIYGLEAAA